MGETRFVNQVFFYINYAWRVIATGICFATFGIGGLILSYIVLPTIELFTSDKKRKHLRAQHAICIMFKAFVILLQVLCVMKIEFKNFAELKKSKGCLIISNHPTLLDYVIIVSQLKYCQVIVKESLLNNIFMQRIIRTGGYIHNTKSIDTFEQIKIALNDGQNLLIFPEGTRTVPNQPLSLQRGAANVAIRALAPIKLLHIRTTTSGLDKNGKWYKVPNKKVNYCVEVGERLEPDTFLQNNVAPSIAARRLTRHLKFELERGMRA